MIMVGRKTPIKTMVPVASSPGVAETGLVVPYCDGSVIGFEDAGEAIEAVLIAPIDPVVLARSAALHLSLTAGWSTGPARVVALENVLAVVV